MEDHQPKGNHHKPGLEQRLRGTQISSSEALYKKIG